MKNIFWTFFTVIHSFLSVNLNVFDYSFQGDTAFRLESSNVPERFVKVFGHLWAEKLRNGKEWSTILIVCKITFTLTLQKWKYKKIEIPWFESWINSWIFDPKTSIIGNFISWYCWFEKFLILLRKAFINNINYSFFK